MTFKKNYYVVTVEMRVKNRVKHLLYLYIRFYKKKRIKKITVK